MRLEEEVRRPGALGDSWGGWVVVLLTSCVLLYSAITILLDGRHPVVTSTGRVIIQTSRRFGTAVALICLGCATVAAVLALFSPRLRSARLGAPVTFPLVLLLSWGALVAWLRGDDAIGIVESGLAVLMALAVVVSYPSATTLSRLSTLRDILAAGSLAYSALLPASAQSACRPDKCGIFGTLWSGLFENENAAAAAIALLIPTLLVAGRARYYASSAIAVMFIAATGSRTAIVATVVALVFMGSIRWRRRQQLTVPLLWKMVPLSALVISLVVFLGTSGVALTGRGFIYAAVREQLDGTALIVGAGPTLVEGLLGGSAHGEAQTDLIMFGVPGLALLLIALAQLLAVRSWSWHRLVALGVLVTASTRFPTEAGLMLNLRTTETAMLLLVVGLFASPENGLSVDRSNRPRSGKSGAKPAPLSVPASP